MIEVSIIIINYNTSTLTLDCINSIKRHVKDVSYEIIVVDNDSLTDENLTKLKTTTDIKYIQSKTNLGFGKANNLGLQSALGEYIFFLNSDTLLLNDAVSILYKYAQKLPEKLGGLGCILENKTGAPIHSSGNLPRMIDDWDNYIITPIKKALGCYKSPTTNITANEKEVGYITGADLMVKRSVLDECGVFNPTFFMYFEETEMQCRFKRKGYDNILIKGPRIIHLEGESTSKSNSSKFIRDTVRQEKSRYIYFKLTEPRWKYYIYRMIHPILRQTTWLNPKVSFKDKWTFMKTLTCRIKLINKENYNEYIN